jgi:hypothetical protein
MSTDNPNRKPERSNSQRGVSNGSKRIKRIYIKGFTYPLNWILFSTST